MFAGDSDVTAVLTSCGRFDLLRRTLDSFFRHNTYPLRDFFLIEDSAKAGVENHIPAAIRAGPVKVRVNRPPMGQVAAVDKVYAEVTTPYIFHMEDDWLFYRPGFIEDSKKILQAEPCALLVQLRSYHHDLAYYGVRPLRLGVRRIVDGVAFHRLESGHAHSQCFSFNPGLRRRCDYPAGGYAALAGGGTGAEVEVAASEHYAARGYFQVVLENDAVKHIGFGRHVVHRLTRWKKHRDHVLRLVAAAAMFALGWWLGAGR